MMTGLPILDGSSAGAFASSSQFEAICVIDPNGDRRRQAFALLSQTPNRVVRCFSAASDFADIIDEIESAVVLVGGSAALEIVSKIQAIIQYDPRFAVVVLVEERDFVEAVHALRLGVSDILVWPVAQGEMEACIRRSLPGIQRAELEWQIRRETSSKLNKLSKRECELLHLLSKGASNNDVAAQLGISIRTVEVHRARLMSRINAKSVADIVKLAMAEELYGTFGPDLRR